MDSQNQNEVEREAEKPEPASMPEKAEQVQPEESKPKITMPKIGFPRLPIIEFKAESFQWIANKLKEYKRVLLITKKPDMEEFKTTVKASALGMTIIGVVGFIIAIIAQLLTT